MKRSLFDYPLPEALIAQTPANRRDESRLLSVDCQTRSFSNQMFSALPELLDHHFGLERDSKRLLLIANDSRVYPARVRVCRKSGARGEVFLLEKGIRSSYRCLLRPLKKLSIGETLYADGTDIPTFVVDSLDPPRVALHADWGAKLDEVLSRFGEMPLPPYIKSDPIQTPRDRQLDRERYQTVYSRDEGSAAAPTAGLHFTPEIISRCKELRIDFAHVTLHVGLGTFMPVQTEEVEDHPMHEELCLVPHATLQTLNLHLERGWPVVFVGTTALRTVESFMRLALTGSLAAQPQLRTKVESLAQAGHLLEELSAMAGSWFPTQLFIRPVTLDAREHTACGAGLLTNFHQPESTLVMLVSALMGFDLWKHMYAHAVENEYRFLSYGDSSLVLF